MIDQLDEFGNDRRGGRQARCARRARSGGSARGALSNGVARSAGRAQRSPACSPSLLQERSSITVHPWGGGRAEAAVLRGRCLQSRLRRTRSSTSSRCCTRARSCLRPSRGNRSTSRAATGGAGPRARRQLGNGGVETLNERQWFDPDHNRVLAMRLDPPGTGRGPYSDLEPSSTHRSCSRPPCATAMLTWRPHHDRRIPVTQISCAEILPPTRTAKPGTPCSSTPRPVPPSPTHGAAAARRDGRDRGAGAVPHVRVHAADPEVGGPLSEKASHPQAATAPISSEPRARSRLPGRTARALRGPNSA